MRKLLIALGIVALLAVGLSGPAFAAEEGVTCTVTAEFIALTVDDGEVAYGTLAPGATKSTLLAELDDTQTVTNTGNVDEVIDAKCSDAVNGTTWQLVLSTDTDRPDEFAHQWSINSGSTWTDFDPNNTTYSTLNASLAQNGTQDFDLKIHMPTSTTDGVAKTITVTVRATKA